MVCLGPALSGCEPESCDGLEVGSEYAVEVRENGPFYTRPGTDLPSCRETDLQVGSVLTFRITDEYEDDTHGCNVAVGELVAGRPFEPIAGTKIRTTVAIGELYDDAVVDWDGCEATWSTVVSKVRRDNITGPYNEGNPDVLLYRGLYPHSLREPDNEELAAACAGKVSCEDNWGVQVTKVR